MPRNISRVLLPCIAVLIGVAGCKEKSPPRNQIPVLKETLYRLQVAVKEHNRAALDSLLSVKMLEYNQNGDSLIGIAHGRDRTFPFETFGGAVFLYTGDNAQIECFVMDSTSKRDQPIRIHMIREGKGWLMSHYSFPDSVGKDSTE
jgi:hypothetical protein